MNNDVIMAFSSLCLGNVLSQNCAWYDMEFLDEFLFSSLCLGNVLSPWLGGQEFVTRTIDLFSSLCLGNVLSREKRRKYYAYKK